MPYTHATVLEVQRLSYTAPASLLHYATEDIEVKSGNQSYTIPRGANVICNLRKFLLDPDIFKEPKKFVPERFLDSDGSIVKYEQVQHLNLSGFKLKHTLYIGYIDTIAMGSLEMCLCKQYAT